MSLRASEVRGEAKVLLEQLQLRFGVLPEPTRARIQTARPEQLDTWTERVLTAQSLDEVLVSY